MLGEVVPSTVWPAYGQAAFVQQDSRSPRRLEPARGSNRQLREGDDGYLVLRDHPLQLGEEGPTITLTDADVADTDRRRDSRSRSCPSPPELN